MSDYQKLVDALDRRTREADAMDKIIDDLGVKIATLEAGIWEIFELIQGSYGVELYDHGDVAPWSDVLEEDYLAALRLAFNVGLWESNE